MTILYEQPKGPVLHHRWCPVCKNYRVHDSGTCLTCRTNNDLPSLNTKMIEIEEEKEFKKEFE